MTYVYSSEVGTICAALDRPTFNAIIRPSDLRQAIGRKPTPETGYIPTEILGRCWNVTANRLPALFANSVGEEHSDTPVVYGRWGATMDFAPAVETRLRVGARLLYVHTDDPRWEFVRQRGGVRFERRWRYNNTSGRGEAFATISDFREWLIVMQRGVPEPINPASLRLSNDVYYALGREEIRNLEGAFGCRIHPAHLSAMLFNDEEMSYRPLQGDHGKFNRMVRDLLGAPRPSTRPLLDPSLLKEMVRRVNNSDQPETIAEALDISTEEFLKIFRKASALEPWCFRLDATAPSRWERALDRRHRKALSEVARLAAEEVTTLHPNRQRLRAVDIGGGTLEVTEGFLSQLRRRTGIPIDLVVVDDVLSQPDDVLRHRKERIESELHVTVELVGRWWRDYAAEVHSDSSFDFAVTFQLLSLMKDVDIENLFTSLCRILRPGGTFFAAFEPFDRVTLPRYEDRGYEFYPRSVDWYREMARSSGLVDFQSDLRPAHRGDDRSMMASFTVRRPT